MLPQKHMGKHDAEISFLRKWPGDIGRVTIATTPAKIRQNEIKLTLNPGTRSAASALGTRES